MRENPSKNSRDVSHANPSDDSPSWRQPHGWVWWPAAISIFALSGRQKVLPWLLYLSAELCLGCRGSPPPPQVLQLTVLTTSQMLLGWQLTFAAFQNGWEEKCTSDVKAELCSCQAIIISNHNSSCSAMLSLKELDLWLPNRKRTSASVCRAL